MQGVSARVDGVRVRKTDAREWETALLRKLFDKLLKPVAKYITGTEHKYM